MSSPKLRPSLGLWLGLAGVVIVLDQATKAWVQAVFRLGDVLPVTDFFDLVFVFNRGAAFSFLAGAGGWQKWFFIGLALAVSAWLMAMLRRHAGERLLPLALALILGGALGNVIDRFRFDAVVDFLSFHWHEHYFPAFNVADSAITLGVMLMLWYELLSKEPAHGGQHSA